MEDRDLVEDCQNRSGCGFSTGLGYRGKIIKGSPRCWQNIPDRECPCGLIRPEAGRMPGKDTGGMAGFLAPRWPVNVGPVGLRSEEVAMLASVFLSEQIWIPSYNNIKIGNGFLGNICTEENIKIVSWRYSLYNFSKNRLARMESEPTVVGLNMLNKVPSCVTWLLAEGTRIKFRFWKKIYSIFFTSSSVDCLPRISP